MVEKNKLSEVSMNGRMAYTIMCVEKFLATKYSNRDWSLVAREMWKSTKEYWNKFSDEFCEIIPDVFLTYDSYDESDFKNYFAQEEFNALKELYAGITEGKEDDSEDEVNFMINKPFEMAMVYEGTEIGDGQESLKIIEEAEKILGKNSIPLPDYTKVLFSGVDELNGWGNDFDGTYLSIILNK